VTSQCQDRRKCVTCDVISNQKIFLSLSNVNGIAESHLIFSFSSFSSNGLDSNKKDFHNAKVAKAIYSITDVITLVTEPWLLPTYALLNYRFNYIGFGTFVAAN
jgi:hypothetical protein